MPADLFIVQPTPPTVLTLKSGERRDFTFTVNSRAAPDKVHEVALQALLIDENGKDKEVDWLRVEPRGPLSIAGGKTERVTITVKPDRTSPRGENKIKLVIADNRQTNEVLAESPLVFCEVSGDNGHDHEPRLPGWLIPAMVTGLLLLVGGDIAIGWKGCSDDGPRGAGVPSGTIAAFGGTTVPDGWLLCDGAPVSRTEHKALYAAVGSAWGAGDGSTTFNLPDLRGFFLRGADDKGLRDGDPKGRRSIVGDQPATGVGSVQRYATAMPHDLFQIANSEPHHHQDPTWTGQAGQYELASSPTNNTYGYDYGAQSAPTTDNGIHSHKLTGGDEETRPINVAVNYIIKE